MKSNEKDSEVRQSRTNSRNNKRRSNNSRSRDKEKFAAKPRPAERSRDNDVSWYKASDQLANDVANLSFNFPAGVPFNLDARYTQKTVFPGVMTIYNAPTPGISAPGMSRVAPINVAAQKIFAYVRKNNAGSTNYDTPDLMLYLLAMDSAYAFAAWMMRIYGIINSYNIVNRYIPDGLLNSQGIYTDVSSIGTTHVKGVLAEFRAYINLFVMRINSLAVPKDIKYFQRHFWMYSGFYKDEDTPKAQFYMYAPAYLYKYAIDAETTAGKLTTVPICAEWSDTNGWQPRTTFMGYNGIRAIGEEILQALLYQQDIAIMSGDILKAYGEEGCMRLNQISSDLQVAATYSEEVLSQIHNTDFIGGKFTNASGTVDKTCLEVIQQTGIGEGDLIFYPFVQWGGGNHCRHVLDHWKAQTTPDDILIMTRNKVMTAIPNNTNNNTYVVSCGSDFALFAVLTGFDFINNTYANWKIYDGSSIATIDTVANDIAAYDAGVFNERPTRILFQQDLSGNVIPWHVDGELSNYAIINYSDLEEIHDAALLSMFGVPYLP